MKRLAFVLLAAVSLAMSAQTISTNDLTTAWGRAVTPENVWREYPRPQLVRGGWESLNGTWEYAVVSVEADEPAKYDGTILVPFCWKTLEPKARQLVE